MAGSTPAFNQARHASWETLASEADTVTDQRLDVPLVQRRAELGRTCVLSLYEWVRQPPVELALLNPSSSQPWSAARQSEFITALFRGDHVGALVLHTSSRGDRELLDGRRRFEAMEAFLEGEIPLSFYAEDSQDGREEWWFDDTRTLQEQRQGPERQVLSEKDRRWFLAHEFLYIASYQSLEPSAVASVRSALNLAPSNTSTSRAATSEAPSPPPSRPALTEGNRYADAFADSLVTRYASGKLGWFTHGRLTQPSITEGPQELLLLVCSHLLSGPLNAPLDPSAVISNENLMALIAALDTFNEVASAPAIDPASTMNSLRPYETRMASWKAKVQQPHEAWALPKRFSPRVWLSALWVIVAGQSRGVFAGVGASLEMLELWREASADIPEDKIHEWMVSWLEKFTEDQLRGKYADDGSLTKAFAPPKSPVKKEEEEPKFRPIASTSMLPSPSPSDKDNGRTKAMVRSASTGSVRISPEATFSRKRELSPASSSASSQASVCKFYQRGTCMFGPGCRNLHPGEISMGRPHGRTDSRSRDSGRDETNESSSRRVSGDLKGKSFVDPDVPSRDTKEPGVAFALPAKLKRDPEGLEQKAARLLEGKTLDEPQSTKSKAAPEPAPTQRPPVKRAASDQLPSPRPPTGPRLMPSPTLSTRPLSAQAPEQRPAERRPAGHKDFSPYMSEKLSTVWGSDWRSTYRPLVLDERLLEEKPKQYPQEGRRRSLSPRPQRTNGFDNVSANGFKPGPTAASTTNTNGAAKGAANGNSAAPHSRVAALTSAVAAMDTAGGESSREGSPAVDPRLNRFLKLKESGMEAAVVVKPNEAAAANAPQLGGSAAEPPGESAKGRKMSEDITAEDIQNKKAKLEVGPVSVPAT